MSDRLTPADAIAIFSALGNEERLRILRLLSEVAPGGMRSGQIARAMGAHQPTTSTRLLELMRAGLVQKRGEGRHQIYITNPRTVRALVNFLGDL